MKAFGSRLALAALLVSMPTDAAAQRDLAGSWDFVITSESGEPQVRIRVEIATSRDGQLLGETGLEGPSEITGSVQGSTIQIFWSATFEGTPVDFRFTGNHHGGGHVRIRGDRFRRPRCRLREQLDRNKS